MRSIIIGGGVIGMSAAVRLAEAGSEVRVWAAAFSPDTTSDVAGAIWWPYHVASPRVAHWGERTHAVLKELAMLAGTGVRLCQGWELHSCAEPPLPEWHRFVEGFRRLSPSELSPSRAGGFAYTVPTIDMPVYLSYLRARLQRAGGELELRKIVSFTAALAQADVVVNCSGLGARELVPDPTVVPVRGEVLRVAPCGPDRFLLDEGNPQGVTYIIPRRNDWILGGTCEQGEASLTPSPEKAEAILARCAEWVPGLRHAPVLSHRVGLRPARPTVRLELERTAEGIVLHNYGHGGGGVTLSWGCAEDVVTLADQG